LKICEKSVGNKMALKFTFRGRKQRSRDDIVKNNLDAGGSVTT